MVGQPVLPANAETGERRTKASSFAPASMAALGDSITAGFNACGWFSDCPERSWSTGNDASANGPNSHFQRLQRNNDKLVAHNNARSGATSHEFPGQAGLAATQQVEYATVLIGANDACVDDESKMTEVEAFRTNIDAGMAALKQANAEVFVISIPDLKQLWEVGKGHKRARAQWALLNICQSMLLRPTSTKKADEERRERVQQRVMDYNTELDKACAAYGSKCQFDDNALFKFDFTADHLSKWDWFHPNDVGQAALAKATYEARFGQDASVLARLDA